MRKNYDVIVTRYTTESCTMLVEASSKDEAEKVALERAGQDNCLTWEQDETPNLSKDRYITSCEEQDAIGS